MNASSCCHATASWNDVDGIWVCDECFRECDIYEDEDEDEAYCSTCNGSGEGVTDIHSCWSCQGTGVEKRIKERV